jgi:hypothetical protein
MKNITIHCTIVLFLAYFGMGISATNGKSIKPLIKESNPKDKEYEKFCEAMGKILAATDKSFAGIMGKITDSTDGVRTWKSKIDLPNVKSSYIRDEMVISKYYRGQFKNVASIDLMKAEYNKYYQYLDKCMKASGYELQKMPNDKGLKDFDDIIYRLPKDSPLPLDKQPFVKMEVVFDESNSVYYLTITINESFL